MSQLIESYSKDQLLRIIESYRQACAGSEIIFSSLITGEDRTLPAIQQQIEILRILGSFNPINLWIDAKKRLPELNERGVSERVLVYTPKESVNKIHLAFLNNYDGGKLSWNLDDGLDLEDDFGYVTLWTPVLPPF